MAYVNFQIRPTERATAAHVRAHAATLMERFGLSDLRASLQGNNALGGPGLVIYMLPDEHAALVPALREVAVEEFGDEPAT
ncbi:MAG: hypothetical protein Q8P41_04900 [Pseudomonadota bacterium]|nr:hypothetical protein [Pseudomonadota bacterium]